MSETVEQAFERGWRMATRTAAEIDPWKEHVARNPIAALLSDPGQCVEVKNKLIMSQVPPDYRAPVAQKEQE